MKIIRRVLLIVSCIAFIAFFINGIMGIISG